ncbi:MAG: hypothetical protein A2X59_10855 [Nitrospirae bacterium GWC2_42_7]|nr:MAG: hypothetical protein A2X59_10855 [Nitrospirae bacterium GWC2_42_7]
MGSIQRSTKNGLDYGKDEFVFSKNGSTTELIKVDAVNNEYRAKIEDGSFLRFYYDGTLWKVYDKDGKVYKYGQIPASRSGTFKWCLDRVEDSNGNFMTISYQPGLSGLSQIKYTGNSNTLPDPTNTIEFIEEGRTDRPYLNNLIITRRLQRIVVKAGNQEIRKYELAYEYSSTERTRLKSIQRYGKNDAQQWVKWPSDEHPKSTVISWSQWNSGFEISVDSNGTPIVDVNDEFVYDHEIYASKDAQYFPSYKIADIDGDGKSDLVYDDNPSGIGKIHVLFSREDGFTEIGPAVTRKEKYYRSQKPFQIGDFNGDGKADVFYEGANKYYHVLLSAGDSFAEDTQYGWGQRTNDYNINIPWTRTGDFNGDGKTDLLYQDNDGKIDLLDQDTSVTHVLYSQGDTFSEVSFNHKPPYLGPLLDVNNDGKTDAISLFEGYTTNGQYRGFVSFALNFYPYDGETAVIDTERNSYRPDILFGDVNGDGTSDVVYEDIYRQIRVKLYQGTYNVWAQRDPSLYDIFENRGREQLIDMNGDGMADFVFEYKKTIYVMQSIGYIDSYGKGFKDPVAWGRRSVSYKDSEKGLKIADVNGDGLVDFVYQGEKNGKAEIHVLKSKSPYPDLVTKIENEIGSSYEITYMPSSAYPNNQIPFVLQTVSSITKNDGLGNSSTTNYYYQNGYYDYKEREFRGFGYVKQTNPNNTTLETWFHQKDVKDADGYYTDDEDLKGKSYKTEFKSSSGDLLSNTTFRWERSRGKTDPAEYPVFVKLKEKMTKNYIGGVETFTTTVNTYDDNTGNLLSAITSGTDAEEVTTTNTYVNFSNIWRVKSTTISGSETELSRITTYEYYPDGKGNLWKNIYWLNNDVSESEEVFTYTAEGNIETVTDANQNITTFYYDDAQKIFPNRIAYPQTNGIAHNVHFEYDYRFGMVSRSWDENNNLTKSIPDVFGRTIETTSYKGSTEGAEIAAKTKIQYFDSGFIDINNIKPNYTKTSVLENNETGEIYIDQYDYFDGLGRNIQTVTPSEAVGRYIVTQTHYDSIGRVDLTKGPFFKNAATADFYNAEYAETFSLPTQCPNTKPCTKTSYYDFGKPSLIESTDSDYGTVSANFEYSGLTTTVKDPEDKIIDEIKDYLGRTIQITEYADNNEFQITTYEYNAVGDLKTVTNDSGDQTIITTDRLGRKTEMQDPDMGKWKYCYDNNGNLKVQIDADGNIIKFDYDALNRPWQKTYFKNDNPSSISDPCTATGTALGNTVTFAYDTASLNGIGSLYSAANSDVTIQYGSYDTMGNPTSETRTIFGDSTYITTYGYDLSGKLTGITYPSVSPISFVENIYYQGTGLLNQVKVDETVYATNLNYTPSGNVGRIDFGNGISTTYTYDPQLTKLQAIKTSNNLIDLTYQFKKAGDIQSITNKKTTPEVLYAYTYDNLHRLKTEKINDIQSFGYDYNAIGNIEKKTIGTTKNYNYVYDPDKIHALKDLVVNGETYARTYKQRGVLYNADLMPYQIDITKTDNSTQTTSLTYDPFGVRAKKSTTPGTTTYYIGEHLEKINNELTAYVFNGGLRIAKKSSSGTYYYHKDHLGSTLAMTAANGDEVETVNYTPYGEDRNPNHPAYSSNYLFTDQEYDPETGLYNYKARLYDPVIGRFISADSIVSDPFDPQSLNRYSYVLNNPLIYTDPTGHDAYVGLYCYGGGGWGDGWGITIGWEWGGGGYGGVWDDYFGNYSGWSLPAGGGGHGGGSREQTNNSSAVIDSVSEFASNVGNSFQAIGNAMGYGTNYITGGLIGNDKLDWDLQNQSNPILAANNIGGWGEKATYAALGVSTVAIASAVALDVAAAKGISYVGNYSMHAMAQSYARRISIGQVTDAINIGKRYFDPKYGSIVSAFNKIAVARVGTVITTIMHQSRPQSRYLQFPWIGK